MGVRLIDVDELYSEFLVQHNMLSRLDSTGLCPLKDIHLKYHIKVTNVCLKSMKIVYFQYT